MPKVKVPDKNEKPSKAYNPKGNEKEVQEYVSARVHDMKEFRKDKLPNLNRSIEDIWKEADQEYQPHELDFEARTRVVTDETEGLRSRLVKSGEDGRWQSNMSSPDFYVKVNTALSILVDQNPEAVFMPSSKKFQANTDLAYGNWKNSWEMSGAKQQLKNQIFNMCRYGVGFMRTHPKLIEMDKMVMTDYYPNDPDKNKFEKRRLVKYNDLSRESLNPWDVWWCEFAKPGDYHSMEDWYYEREYSWDKLKQEFKDYDNLQFVPKGATDPDSDESKGKSQDSVTVGFYENQVLDMYVIWIPEANVVLHHSPLPNDDGMLSLSFAPWTLRDDRHIAGIGLYEIIRNDSILYDRLLNMTMDQLVLSIYKMFFYKGTNILGENDQLVLTPGKGEQVSDPQAINFLDVPGPGGEAWAGLAFLQDRKDSMSGVTPQLTARLSGNKTLGQDVQAKEAALERMKTPLDFILDSLQQEAYITLSWQKQILSTPEILEYTDEKTLVLALNEMGVAEEDIAKYVKQLESPERSQEMLFDEVNEDTGEQRRFANVFPESSFSLEMDEEGELIESEEQKFYRFGVDLPTQRLDWKGIIRIKPQSVLAPSKELTRRQKLDLFNIVYPAIQTMLAQPMHIPVLFPSIKQIIKVFEEDQKDWFDEEAMMMLMEDASKPLPPPPPDPPKMSFSINVNELPGKVQGEILQKYAGITNEEPLFVDEEGKPNEDPLFVKNQPSPADLPGGPAPQSEPLKPRDSVSRANNTGDLMQIKD